MFVIWIISFMLMLFGGTIVIGDVLTKRYPVVGKPFNISFKYPSQNVVTWLKNGVDILSVDGTGNTCIPIPSNADYNIYCEDGGKKYTLEVKNVAVTDKEAIFETEAPPTRNYTMNYFQDPSIPVVLLTSTPAATNCVQLTDTMVLKCEVDCTKPEPTLKWKLQGKELPGGLFSTESCSDGSTKVTSLISINVAQLININNTASKYTIACELSYGACVSSENMHTNTTCVQIVNTDGSRARGSRKTSIDQQKDNITENEGENKQTNNKKTEKDSKDKQTNYELTENQREEHTTENARPGDKKPRELPLPSYTRPLPPIKSKA